MRGLGTSEGFAGIGGDPLRQVRQIDGLTGANGGGNGCTIGFVLFRDILLQAVLKLWVTGRRCRFRRG